MKLYQALQNPDHKYLEQIINGEEMPLVRVKEIVDYLQRREITDFVLIIGFTAANFLIIPAEAVTKTKRAPKCLIDGRYVYASAAEKTDFKTIEQIIARIDKWLDIWGQIRSNHQWVPTVIAYVQGRGFVWCNKDNQSVTDNMIDFYENGIPEAMGKEGAIDIE